MSVPYKHYLEALDRKSGLQLWSKLLIVLFVLIFSAVGTASALLYKYQEEEPARRQYQYLQSVSTDFESSSQSLEELLLTFKVAGDKIAIVDSLQESSESASGFFVSLDDIEKEIAIIDTTRDNFNQKQLRLVEKSSPRDLTDLSSQIIEFYNQSASVMSDLYDYHLFAKQVLLASGPKFYLPILTNEKLWEKSNKVEIINYYQSTKEEANVALTNMAKLSPPPHFQEYYGAQMAYLTLLVNLADNIINTLSISDGTDPDSATQIEKAYQLLVGAKRENESISKKLLEEKLKISDVKENLARLAQIEIRKISIQENLAFAFAQTPAIKEPKLPLFLRGLQIPSLF